MTIAVYTYFAAALFGRQGLDDSDESIRLRALDLLYGMVSKKNLMEVVKKLMMHMDKAEGTTYRYELFSFQYRCSIQN